MRLKFYQVSFTHFLPQWNETISQYQKENWKILKYVKIKQHTFERPLDQRRNQKEN